MEYYYAGIYMSSRNILINTIVINLISSIRTQVFITFYGLS